MKATPVDWSTPLSYHAKQHFILQTGAISWKSRKLYTFSSTEYIGRNLSRDTPSLAVFKGVCNVTEPTVISIRPVSAFTTFD